MANSTGKQKKNAKAGHSNAGTRKNKGRHFFKSIVSFLKNDKFHRIFGLFLVILSISLFFALTSYFFTWKSDAVIKPGDQAGNWIGMAGRWISKLFIERWFGIASMGFVLLLIIYGFRLLIKTSLLPLWKTTRLTTLIMIWFSVTFGFLWGNHDSLVILGGKFGKYYAAFLSEYIGKAGAGFLLLFFLLSFLIFNFNLSFSFLKKIKFPKRSSGKKTGPKNKQKEDIYNTAEYALDDGDIIHFRDDQPKVPDERVDNGESEVAESDNLTETKTYRNPDEVELTIEKSGMGSLQDVDSNSENGGENQPEHHTVDEPYDPWLDLPDYRFPSLDLLEDYGRDEILVDQNELDQNKKRIVETLNNYSIQILKIKATIGPTVTLYEIIPAPGVRIAKIKNLEDDIALSLSAFGIRIIAPIPGKGTIGIEVPNQKPDIVSMKSVLASDKFQNNKFELPFGMGKTISNESFVADLTRMPHILMAGATGQGKSVGLNAIITSLIYKKHPSELKFVMVDPKKVELTLYSKIERHFLAKLPDSEEAIITDTRKVVRTLNSLGIEMDNRYELLKDAQVRNIKEYNAKFKARKLNPLHGHRFLAYIVLVIDEFADLIMTAGKEIEIPITRLAQLARAVGIHLIIATQRPSVNIITGSIKANFPARLAFRVISKIDSRTILDSSGADQLIGRGDMLLSTGSDLLRLQCAFIDTPEIDKLTDFIGSQRAYPDALHLPDFQDEESEAIGDFDPNDRDEFFEDAARIIVQTQQGSTSLLQRKLKLGYNRAGRIIDQLEAAGIVGPFEGSKARDVKVANEVALEQFLKDLQAK
ncbi:MAG: DNA translocase FtsK 4TM domain-containing protein [Bacteroidales bacterium]